MLNLILSCVFLSLTLSPVGPVAPLSPGLPAVTLRGGEREVKHRLL